MYLEKTLVTVILHDWQVNNLRLACSDVLIIHYKIITFILSSGSFDKIAFFTGDFFIYIYAYPYTPVLYVVGIRQITVLNIYSSYQFTHLSSMRGKLVLSPLFKLQLELDIIIY